LWNKVGLRSEVAPLAWQSASRHLGIMFPARTGVSIQPNRDKHEQLGRRGVDVAAV
jgi:hypothetical protein